MNLSFFENKTILITGASSGIGKAIVEQLKIVKCKLIITARNTENLIFTNSISEIFPYSLDLNNPENIISFSAKIKKDFEKIDVVILNAGVSQRSLFENTNINVIRKIMEVNFFGNAILIKELLPELKKSKSSHIVPISSIVGKFGFYYRSGYSSAKHAILGLFESIRLENEKDNINVNIMFPGVIKTSISENSLDGEGNLFKEESKQHNVGMESHVCALKILKAIEKNKKETFIGKKELLLVYIKRFLPSLFFKLVKSQNPDGKEVRS